MTSRFVAGALLVMVAGCGRGGPTSAPAPVGSDCVANAEIRKKGRYVKRIVQPDAVTFDPNAKVVTEDTPMKVTEVSLTLVFGGKERTETFKSDTSAFRTARTFYLDRYEEVVRDDRSLENQGLQFHYFRPKAPGGQFVVPRPAIGKLCAFDASGSTLTVELGDMLVKSDVNMVFKIQVDPATVDRDFSEAIRKIRLRKPRL